MVTLIQDFEQSGDWVLHVKTVHQMIPHFHAAGHLAYAKYVHLYLEDVKVG